MSADLDGMIGNLDVSAKSVTDLKSEELPVIGRNWDFEMKHIFILSSSGKPIFSKHGDEQSLSTTFGLIQAIVSIVENTGDRIVCIAAQKRRIVWFLRNSLYFVSISTSDEPEAVLSAQLEFMYDQIIFVLTSKVHEVLRLNPSKDIRDLLGYDTIKQMHLSCSENSTPAYVAFRAVTAFVCAEDLRIMIQLALKNCVDVSGSVFGVVLFRDQLLTFITNATTDLELATSDFLLLANFVGKSNSLRSNDQNWVPICLPEFNPDAYVQAYICNIHLLGGTASKNLDISLVLISTSAEPVMFNALHLGRQQFESRIQQSDIPDRLIIAFESQQAYLSIYSVPTSCLNFFTLLRPMLVSSKSSDKLAQKKSKSSSSKRVTVPASAPVQCHSFTPDNDSLSQSASDCDFTSALAEYQHLALYLRTGSSLPERTLAQDYAPIPTEGVKKRKDQTKSSLRRQNAITEAPPPLGKDQECCVLYSVLASKMIVVCVHSEGSELYATFPSEMSVAQACTAAKSLSQNLKRNGCHLYQLNS